MEMVEAIPPHYTATPVCQLYYTNDHLVVSSVLCCLNACFVSRCHLTTPSYAAIGALKFRAHDVSSQA